MEGIFVVVFSFIYLVFAKDMILEVPAFVLYFYPQGWIDNFNGPSGLFVAVSNV